jgi:hypothetical protein
MLRIVLSMLVVILCSAAGQAAAAPAACERLEQQRDRLYQQLRRPHSAQRGNQLRARLRDLTFRIGHECR